MPRTARTQCVGRWGLVATLPTGSPLLQPWRINPTLHLQGSLVPSVRVQSLCCLQKLLRFAWCEGTVGVSQYLSIIRKWQKAGLIWTAAISLDTLYLPTALALFCELSSLEDNFSGILKLCCFCYSISIPFLYVKRCSASCSAHAESIRIFVEIILFLMLLTVELAPGGQMCRGGLCHSSPPRGVVQKHKAASSCSIWIFLQCYVNIYK